MFIRTSRAAVLVAFALLPSAIRAEVPTSHTENFVNAVYADTVATSALWDTQQGVLRLAPLSPALASIFPALTPYYEVCVAGDYAFVAAFSAGMLVVDIKDRTSPVQVDSVYTHEQVSEIDVEGNYAYLANIFDGLCVVDITDPTNAIKIIDVETLGQTLSVDVQGNYAYLADGPRGLAVMDVTDPTLPVLVAELDTPGYAQRIRVSGNTAFIADWGSGLQVFDISDPTAPTLVGSLDTPGFSRALAVSGDIVYLCDSNPGLHLIDVSNPASPVLLSTVDTPGVARGVKTDGVHAYVADHTGGMVIVDVRDATQPIVLQSVFKNAFCYGVDVRGRWLYAASHNGGLHTMEIADVVSPPVSAGSAPVGGGGGVDISGPRAFVAEVAGGMSVVDVTNPWAPDVVGQYTTSYWSQDVAVDGSTAFIANFGSPSFEVVDIGDPTFPVQVGSVSPLDFCNAVVVDGNTAYVTGLKFSNAAGFAAVDVTDLAAPNVIGFAPVQAAQDLRVDGNTAFVLFDAFDVPSGLAMVDITDPSNPAIVGSYQVLGASALSLVIQANRAYVGFDSDVHVLDITDVTSPTKIGAIPIAAATAIVIAGDIAVIATGGNVASFDISNIASPVSLGSAASAGTPWHAAISGDYAFFPSSSAGLAAIRVFNRDGRPAANAGVSLPLNDRPDTVLRARLSTTQHGNADYSVSADDGLSWQPIVPDGAWNRFDTPGAAVRWRGELAYNPVQGSVEPFVDSLAVDWLYEYPVIAGVADVGGDQGRHVMVQWLRSGHDFADSPMPIESYTVFRLGVAGWDSLQTLASAGEDSYAATVTTNGDATDAGIVYTAYRVRANAGNMEYQSPADSGFSVDNIAPDAPPTLWVGYKNGTNRVTWKPSVALDVVEYRVYRGVDPGFLPSLTNLVHAGPGTSWTDPNGGPADVYKIIAVDGRPNESEVMSQTTITAVGEEPSFDRFALYQNVPNPFNPTTSIRYVIAAPGSRVTLRIYDVRGALVKTLVDRVQPPGEHAVSWGGETESGGRAASGVYFCRLIARGFEQTRKMVLVQ